MNFEKDKRPINNNEIENEINSNKDGPILNAYRAEEGRDVEVQELNELVEWAVLLILEKQKNFSLQRQGVYQELKRLEEQLRKDHQCLDLALQQWDQIEQDCSKVHNKFKQLILSEDIMKKKDYVSFIIKSLMEVEI